VYRYRLFDAAGADKGEAYYAVLIKPREMILTGDGRKLRVLDVFAVDEDDSPYVGLLKVEPV
jgi:hypothetical protein